MDISSIWGFYTLLLMIVFVVIAVWAWSGKRKKRFDEAANLPFADEPAERRKEEPRREDEDKEKQS